MKWIEIIRLRALDHLKQTGVLELLRQIAADQAAADVTFMLYQHTKLANDMSIHLAWQTDVPEQGKSVLGQQLACLLREFGFVDYSVWIETGSLNSGITPP